MLVLFDWKHGLLKLIAFKVSWKKSINSKFLNTPWILALTVVVFFFNFVYSDPGLFSFFFLLSVAKMLLLQILNYNDKSDKKKTYEMWKAYRDS